MFEQLKGLITFEYCIQNDGDPISYQFGWKDGLHFYIDDYLENTVHEGRFVMIIWLDKKMIFADYFYALEPLIEKIREFL